MPVKATTPEKPQLFHQHHKDMTMRFSDKRLLHQCAIPDLVLALPGAALAG
ncbi:hypothetical protein Thiosp_03208 [Thiorhodovibrio litoralis]|nr:hypothetical protein Thiosp_03208 [Thiorhodovibrio litoralis]